MSIQKTTYVLISNASGYEIVGNFRSQIRVCIYFADKIVFRNKYEWSEEKISDNFVPKKDKITINIQITPHNTPICWKKKHFLHWPTASQ
jgi:hypothetical protein